jgi:hypothetical protein
MNRSDPLVALARSSATRAPVSRATPSLAESRSTGVMKKLPQETLETHFEAALPTLHETRVH